MLDVEKGKGEFVVAMPYGEATALGTVFEMNLIDEMVANTREKIEMLELKVTEGTVAVSNSRDAAAWAANFNVKAVLDLAKGRSGPEQPPLVQPDGTRGR